MPQINRSFKKSFIKRLIIGHSLAEKGKNEYLGIAITGYRSTENGKAGITSPTIRFTDAEDNINAPATDLFDDLQKEIWMYLFKGKKAQPDLMDLISQEEQEQSGLNNMRVAL